MFRHFVPRAVLSLALAFTAVSSPARAQRGGRADVPKLAAPTAPAAPTATVQATPNGVQVSWQAINGASQYIILRAAAVGAAAAPIARVAPNALSYLDAGFHSAAAYQVAVVMANGAQSVSAQVAFTPAAGKELAPAPMRTNAPLPTATQQTMTAVVPARVTGITPARGGDKMTAKITIMGSGFSSRSPLAVKFTGASGQQDVPAPITAHTDGMIDVVLPAGAQTGPVRVEVGSGGDMFASTSPGAFTVAHPIEVTRFAPDSTSRGGKITIYGRYFSQWDKVEVRFAVQTYNMNPALLGPVQATNKTDGSFDVTVPPAAITGGLQILGSNGVLGAEGSTFVAFSSAPLKVGVPFRITGIDPGRVRQKTPPQPGVTYGPTEPSVNISGEGFLNQPDLSVYFTGASGAQDQLAGLNNKRDDQLMVWVPAGARTGKVKVVLGSGAAAQSTLSAGDVTVTAPMQITGISPASAPRGASVTIQGSGFTNYGGANVQFFGGNGVNQGAQVTSQTDNSITVTVPAGASSGKFSVTGGAGSHFETVTSAMDFAVAPNPLSIESFTPAGGGPGTMVSITGYSHVAPIVNFANGIRATNVSTTTGASTPKGPLSVTTAQVPQGAVTGPITILTAEGSVASKTAFTVPTIKANVTDFTPKTGGVGTMVTIQGTFDPVAANNVVTFGGWGSSPVTAPVISATATTLQVAVPAGAKTGQIIVATALGQSGIQRPFWLPPSVTGFSTPGAPVGYDIDINGDGFFLDPQQPIIVKFNGVQATAVRPWSNTVIKVTVPTGATTGPVTVQTPAGIATSPMAFTIR